MKSIRRPLVLALAGAALALAGGVTAVAASLGASAAAAGRFPVSAHEGMAPGSVSALVFLVGLCLVGVGAAIHDGRELRRPARRLSARPGARPAARPVYVITTLPQRVTSASTPGRRTTRGRRTASGARLELVGARRS